MRQRLVSVPDAAFIEDYKKAAQEQKDIAKLKTVISLLEQQIKLPRSYRPHPLNRAFLGFYSVHVEPDWILIYRVSGNALFLARLGSHEELYGP